MQTGNKNTVCLFESTKCSIRIIQTTPGISRSHVLFNHRFAETLTLLNHTVYGWSIRVEDNYDMQIHNPNVHEYRYIQLDNHLFNSHLQHTVATRNKWHERVSFYNF
jgi:hypothetical protein